MSAEALAAPATPALAPRAAEQSHYESLYSGLDKVSDNLSAEDRTQLDTLTAAEDDPAEAKARMVNLAYLKSKNPQIDEDALTSNWEAAKVAYSKQILGVDKPAVSDTELYSGIAGRIKKDRDERGLIADGMGKMFEAFRQGAPDWRQTFTTSLAEMKGKPGYDPARLDVYRHLARTLWDGWSATGQHYPAAVEAVGSYMRLAHANASPEAAQVEARRVALQALGTVPADQQDAILGLAVRQKGEGEQAGFEEKLAGRLDAGIGQFGASATSAFRDLLLAPQPGGLSTVLYDTTDQRAERKLDAALAGGVDPYRGAGWFSEGILGAAEGVPRMLAMAHPAGVAANLLAFAHEARGHFEDAGVAPERATGLAIAASIPLTALQAVSSKTVMGSAGTGALEGWMLRNISGKVGGELAKGYAKNMLAAGAENTALLYGVTAAQQFTEPALQSLGHVVDGTIPGVKWTGPDGELSRFVGATPHTLATLLPLVALGTGASVLRTRGGALELAVVQNRAGLEALGLTHEGIERIMAADNPTDAVNLLQDAMKKRGPASPAAIAELNKQGPAEVPTRTEPPITLATDGGYNVRDESGAVEQVASPEMASEVANLHTEGEVVPFEISDADRARMREEESGQLEDRRGTELLDWARGRLPRPEEARAQGNPLAGELQGIWDNLVKPNKRGKMHSRQAEAFFAKKGEYSDLDRLAEAARAEGFDFSTPGDLLAAIDNSQRGNPLHSSGNDAQAFGITANGGKLGDVLNQGLGAVRQLSHEIGALPEFAGFKETLNRWVGDTQLGIMHTAADVRRVIAALPTSLARRGMGRWLDAGGDRKTLEEWRRSTSKESAKNEYAAALALTPEQVKTGEAIQSWFKSRFERAVAAGIMQEGNFRQNYLTQIIERPFVQGGDNSKFGGQLNKNFKYSQERTFPNLFDLEQAGFGAKTTDVAEIMARYDTALNKAILSRQLVKDLLEAKNGEGEPLAVPLKGTVKEGEGSEPNFISNPRQTKVDQLQAKIDGLTKRLAEAHETLEKASDRQMRFDAADEITDLRQEIQQLRDEQTPEDAKLYKSIDHPSLRKYWWISKDAETGKDTFMEGDIGLHPTIKTHMENALGTSGLRRWYDSEGNMMSAVPKVVVKAIDLSNGFLKRNLLGGLSLFHAVHEYKRALGNRVAVNPFRLPEINPENARVKMQVRTGLMLATPHDVTNLYDHSAGLGGAGSLVDQVPGLGKLSKGVSEYTFGKLIPALKSEVWNHVYERNLETFKEAIASGQATKLQVAYLTSHQINARFGHQNLADIGRNPTFQHILQIGTLAPDFWESNARNYGQTVQGLIGAKVGKEAALAFATTAAVIWLTSRVINKAADDDWHFDEPFSVVAGGRKYTMRNEVEDLVRLWENARGYVMGRLSPTSQAFEEWRSGTNWRGEKITTAEVFKNWISKVFPMSLRFLPGIKQATDALETGGGRTVSVFQQFLGSLGVQVSRHSPLTDAYQLANEWKKERGDKEDRGTYPVSKYQQLRYALEDGDDSRAIEEIAKLKKGGDETWKILRGLRSSLTQPWTGSRETDAEFKASLSPEKKEIIEKAEAHRAKLLERALPLLLSDAGPGASAKVSSYGIQRDEAGKPSRLVPEYEPDAKRIAAFKIERDTAGKPSKLVPEHATDSTPAQPSRITGYQIERDADGKPSRLLPEYA